MCGGRDTHGGTVVLSVGLGAVPAQEQAAQIRHLATEKHKQFRVSARGTRKTALRTRRLGISSQVSRRPSPPDYSTHGLAVKYDKGTSEAGSEIIRFYICNIIIEKFLLPPLMQVSQVL